MAARQTGTLEAVALSAKDGTLDCLVQVRVRFGGSYAAPANVNCGIKGSGSAAARRSSALCDVTEPLAPRFPTQRS